MGWFNMSAAKAFANSVNRVLFAYAALATMAFTVGCSSSNEPPAADPSPTILRAQEATRGAATQVGDSAAEIDRQVEGARQDTPPEVKPKLEPRYTAINGETDKLRGVQTKLDLTVKDLDTAKSQSETLKKSVAVKNDKIKSLEKKNTGLAADITKLKSEKNSLMNMLLAVVIAAGVVGIGISVALLCTGNRLGYVIAVACAGSIGAAVLVTQYAIWIAAAAGVIALAGIGVFVYEVLIKGRGMEENTALLELTKKYLPEEIRHTIFGDGNIADAVQSSTTKTQVAKLRKGVVTPAPSLVEGAAKPTTTLLSSSVSSFESGE